MKAWFNERGYYIEAPKGESKFSFEMPPYILNDASLLYSFRWIVFNQTMESIRELLGEDLRGVDLELHSDSRLIEELQGEVTPDNYFAKSSLRYFLMYDSMQFGRIDYRKCSAGTINSRLQFDGKSQSVQL